MPLGNVTALSNSFVSLLFIESEVRKRRVAEAEGSLSSSSLLAAMTKVLGVYRRKVSI